MAQRGDHSDYLAFLRRGLRAAGRRVADGDPEDLEELLALQADLDAAVLAAVAGLRERYSWTEIARGTGTSRQAVYARFVSKLP